MLNAYRLGASLYVPVTHKDVLPIANGIKWPELRSVIFCTEDAVAAKALGAGLDNLRACLRQMSATSTTLRFVRVRNPEILGWLTALPGVEKLDGFVLPKLDINNADAYLEPLRDTQFHCMPTLETRDVFEPARMIALRDYLLESNHRERILALRIGGNDLLALLGIRRPRDRTVYRTPLGHTIANLVTVFKPFGFQLTAPVFEHIDCPEILREELSEDVAHGLCGKTAIHPDQLAIIESGLEISEVEVETAQRILSEDQAVFRLNGSMCEVATHSSWARNIIERSAIES
ncbi:HpcH/HpaI aldolase/citrate lyase family protein [Thiorhodococcus mannitoliphagus]|uniref:HpcH/HpaI aldolase/citrate lyase family protein n=1 Tax=Thiorhodococcus mannitoliphagus TaxID=329406 RepID=A0A6P1DV06_9GAMM|nr:HpcH/HpaI aldolase/citrate lyase family protein [Thiorhodococcus mannitoliphagus]NEX21033.1 HpcH/HpaI aldolase/citrate lyase family protein [Thiorhodococcus mannitoliphagus]